MRSRNSFLFLFASLKIAVVFALALLMISVRFALSLLNSVVVLVLLTAMIDVTAASRSPWMCASRFKLASTWLDVDSPSHHAEVSKKPLATSAAIANGMHAADAFSPRTSSLHTQAAAARVELVTSFAISCVERVAGLVSTLLHFERTGSGPGRPGVAGTGSKPAGAAFFSGSPFFAPYFVGRPPP